MLAHQYATWVQYPAAVKARIEIILVDDASPEPAADVARPDGLPALRIFRLHGEPSMVPRWRQHAGRNRAAHEALAPWLLLTDMDHVVPAFTLDLLLECIRFDIFPEPVVVMFKRVDAPDMTPKLKNGLPHPHTNSFAVEREWFWEIGGYDEELTGYGTDGFFLPKLKGRNGQYVVELVDRPIIRYPREVIPDASTWADRDAAKRRTHANELVRDKARRGLRPMALSVPACLVYSSEAA